MTRHRSDAVDRKQEYEGILRAVDANTGAQQPAGMRLGVLAKNRSHAGLDPDTVELRVEAAKQNGDLLQWTDADGSERVALPGLEAARAMLEAANQEVSVETVRDVIVAEATRDDPPKALIGAMNQLQNDLAADS